MVVIYLAKVSPKISVVVFKYIRILVRRMLFGRLVASSEC
jgi:hypothetical protein